MIKCINLEDNIFPENLKCIKNPPTKLFYEGDINLLNSLCFSVVGSRDLTNYGRRIEKKFVKELSLRGITIVSGMAVGADTVAHSETLKYNGRTIAVLPCGLNNIYPKENIELYKNIVDSGGLVISEYENNVEAESKRFLERNRIVSAVSYGLLVVEAKHRSGTSVTAGLAKEQGKKVFAIPGRLDSKNGIGVNRLIKEGAIMAISVNDIIDEIPEFQDLKKESFPKNNFVKKEYRKIYTYLNDEPIGIDELCLKTNNSIQATLNLLSLMEIDDLVEEIVGAGYVRKYKE